MNHLLSKLILALLLVSSNVLGQSGDNDASFNNSDIGFANGDGFDGQVYTYAIQPDGKILVGGAFGLYNSYTCENIIRLLPNGKVDSSFQAIIPSGFVEKILLLNDGKMLVGGTFNPINGSSPVGLVRLNADGSPDNNFNTNGAGTDGDVRSIALQSDGKIIITGDFTTYNGITQNFLSRLNEDGTLDNTFHSGFGQFNSGQRAMVVQSDDKILIGGMFSSYDGNTANHLVRLNSDGTFDNSFNIPGSGLNNKVEDIVLQDDDKILVGGLFTSYNGTALTSRLARLNTDGALDNTFNPNIQITGGKIFSITVQDDGKILIGQGFIDVNTLNQVRLIRLNADGSTDNTFIISEVTSPAQGGFVPNINTINVLDDGNILVGGIFISFNNTPANYSVKLSSSGVVDQSFNAGTGSNGYIRSIKLQDDGKILIGGDYTAFNGANSRRISRLNTNGSLDTGFSVGLGPNAEVRTIAFQNDGKILAGGAFTKFNSVQTNRIIRLNSDGSLDNSFNTGTGANDAIDNIIIQADGKVIVGGNFTSFNGVSKNRILRLNTDGSIDNTFITGSGLNDEVYDIELQADGKIVIVGFFTYYNGNLCLGAVRLNPDGSFDASFDTENGANYIVQALAIQNDGKMLIGGGFSTYNNVTVGNIARINPDGTLDNTFNTGTGANSNVNSMEITNDGKILVVGDFTTYNGATVNHIVKLNSDGSLDSSFNSGLGANNKVYSMALQSDGRILIGGTFTGYNTTGRNRIARILNCGTIDILSTVTNITCFNGNDGSIGIIPSGGIPPYTYFWSNGSTTSNLSGLVPGIYSVILIDSYGCSASEDINVTQPNQLTSNISETACGSYTWPLNGEIYNVSGQYSDTVPSSIGCDSVITLNLTINYSSSAIDVQTSCDSLTWIDGVTYYASTNTPVWIIPNAAGCDSIITLNLTVNHSSSGIDVQTACDSLTWIDGVTYYASTNTPTWTIPNAIGCDSIITLNLIITNSTFGIDVQTSCDSLTWIDGVTYYTSTNTPVWTIPNAIGCDSIITLNLTVNHSSSGTDVQTACDSLTWINGITYYASTNTPTWVLPNAADCDSVITLNLTIFPSVPTVIENTFSLPSDANSCVGEIAVMVSGNNDFELSVDNGSSINSSGYNLITDLCPGIHDLNIINSCGDSTSTQFVIPVDSNYVFNNPFIDSLAQDSLGTTLTDCDIYYAGIDTAYIDSIWANGNTVNVIWNIVDSNGSNFDTTSYVLNNGNGVYWLQLSVFCPVKAMGDYFTVTEAIYFNDGNVSSAGITDWEENSVLLYPNPTNDLVTISFAGNEAKLTIYDAQGKLIQTSGVQSGETVSLKDVETGVYFFELVTNKGSVVKRVMKN